MTQSQLATKDSVWTLLIVDDEKDIHEVTGLAFKRRSWRKRPFDLISCYSAREAMDMLAKGPPNRFQVAIVDVVMETETAGLDLCRHLRSEYPSSVRIVLRTGQPGVAPEERIINEYDIDAYMAKPDVTPERLYATVRSCLRSSQDIETLIAFSRQLRNFTSALQTISTDADLEVFMNEGLRFLELKHQVSVAFVKSIDVVDPSSVSAAAITAAHEKGLPAGTMLSGADHGLGSGHILLFAVRVEGSEQTVRGGFLVDRAQSGFTLHALQNDLTLFMQNWTIAHGAVLLQQRVAREKMLNERMYIERIEGIANMVTGVAHEINTPLGVANTANGMIVSLASEIARTQPGSADLEDLVKDLTESSELLSKNLDRASRLVRSFKQLSSSQLSDERCSVDIGAVMTDCIEAMRVETKKRKVNVKPNWNEKEKHAWLGFPGHLSQVLLNFFQNALRYAYEGDEGGDIDLRLITQTDGSYVIEFEDYGRGVAPAILPRMFEPFVTSGREIGGTGLGLAITHNIVTNILKGEIRVTSAVGKGTKFTVRVPRRVPDAAGDQAMKEDADALD
jgi:signal transduction histidine kinase/ActR/RegA family two-component response regulator